ncbi:MAG: PQQ-like beta-propeller repeat protein [Gemmataceae bacterium]|nr:PQQ-like beta-propeller repeat protein [Gemmataceae bacterium]
MRWLTLGLLCLAPAAALRADDWPQFLGPRRDGVSAEAGVKAWGPNGPKVLWSRGVGPGYAGAVVAGERLILFHRVGNDEVVECVRADTGKPVWKSDYPTKFEDDFGKGDGPRATPVIAGGSVVTFGADGWLHAFELESGKKLWGRNVVAEYRVPPGFFGVGSSPMVVGDRVLVNVGGKDAGIVAFGLDSGKELWRATGDGASYSSPTTATVGGVTHAVFFTRQGVVLLDPTTGDVRFQTRWRARIEASVNAATPLILGDTAFFSTSYDTGALLIKLKKDGAEKLWDSDAVMTNHYNTSIHRDGHLYGFHGRQEAGASFRCVELNTHKVCWDRPRFGCGSMILAGDRIIVLTESGELLLVEATPQAYRELARAQVLTSGPCRAQIALANGRLYARDQKKLSCFAVK